MKMFEVVENWALHAFADGELQGEERQAIERLLAENEEARKALSDINYQKSELRKAYGATVDEPVPATLLDAAQSHHPRGYLRVVASLALLLIGGSGGWYLAQHSESVQAASLEQRALIAHEVFSVEVKHPVEVAASERVHLQAWLSKRVGTPITIPTLDFDGFEFLGGRMLVGENSPAGQLMYEASDKQRLTVFISSNDDGKDEALRIEAHGKLVTCYWRDGKLAVAVTSEMGKDDMMTLAKNVYDQMEQKG
jgi:anti-sigma factor RsiW